MTAVSNDRAFADVRYLLQAWEVATAPAPAPPALASPIERAWRRLGWRLRFIEGLADVCAFCVTDMPPAIYLPAWAEAAPPCVRAALIKAQRDRWEEGAHAAYFAPWVEALFTAVLEVVCEDEGGAFA